MAKVLAFDFGEKRTGLAITDDLAMIASPLETVGTDKLFPYLEKLFAREKISVMVVGEAKRLNGEESRITHLQRDFVEKLSKKFPGIQIVRIDEMFTSIMASQAMIMAGFKKSERQQKGNIDKISATLILQSYLDQKERRKD